MLIYTVYLMEYRDDKAPIITHVKSFKSLTYAETYCQELKEEKKKLGYDANTCIVLNELW